MTKDFSFMSSKLKSLEKDLAFLKASQAYAKPQEQAKIQEILLSLETEINRVNYAQNFIKQLAQLEKI